MASTVPATVTASILSTVTKTVSSATASSTGVPEQAGILVGSNPVVYNSSNPVILFIVQAGIVIIFCQLLHFPLRWFQQPRVIAEVLGGIILGPSVMMRIPGFQKSIFPTASLPVFNNVANLGLIFFLFLVALEVDIRLFVMNWRPALSVGLAGMLLPFALGFAISRGLYDEFSGDEGTVKISFGIYGLFIGTALAITAFPVLCRILTELKLLRSSVGVTVLAAGVSNDITGWILLALCVALVNNGSGLAALWVLLTCIGWILFLVFSVRPVFIIILRRTGSLQNGPPQLIVALTMLLVLTSAWFTGVIGIHPIFGAFLVGLICPHDGGFAIKLTEKIEDLVSVIFLPLYFAYSGLSTNLGLLNDGITWAYVVGVIACAFAGKIIGGTLAAKANKLLWRESLTIGCLMSCKGLVELIVLNIGLQARILSQRTFTMFVVMALITTVATTPLTKALYPPWYREKVDKWRHGEIDWDGNPLNPLRQTDGGSLGENLNNNQFRRVLVYLRLDCLPSLFALVSLLGQSQKDDTTEAAGKEGATTSSVPVKRPMEVHGLRMVELTDRTSSVMHVTEGEELYSLRDPVVNAFKAFSHLHDLAASGRAVVVPSDSYAETLLSQALDVSADFALIPWSEYGSVTEDLLVPLAVTASERFRSAMQLEFVQAALARAQDTCSAGIFIDNGFGGLGFKPTERPNMLRSRSAVSIPSSHMAGTPPALPHKGHHIFLPFFGGADDRLALRLVLQLARNPSVTATIAHIRWPLGEALPSQSMEIQNDDDDDDDVRQQSDEKDPAHHHSKGVASLGRSSNNPAARGAKTWSSNPEDDSDAALLEMLQCSLSADLLARIRFEDGSGAAVTPGVATVTRGAATATPGEALAEMLSRARKAVGGSPGPHSNAGDIVVAGRRHVRLSGETTSSSAGSPSEMTLRETIGTVAERLVSKGVKASILVVQAAREG